MELSCCKNAGSSDSFDFSLSNLAEELSLDDNRLGRQEALAQHLEEASLGHVDHWDSVLVGSVEGPGLLRDESPKFFEVDGGEVESVPLEGEVPDALFAEVAGVVSIHGGSVVSEATGVTPTS